MKLVGLTHTHTHTHLFDKVGDADGAPFSSPGLMKLVGLSHTHTRTFLKKLEMPMELTFSSPGLMKLAPRKVAAE
jgi:hypothetical protein